MPDVFPSAIVELKRLDGTSTRWSLPLTSQTPLGQDELRAALVVEFVGSQGVPDNFKLVLSGTLGEPHFSLSEGSRPFGDKKAL